MSSTSRTSSTGNANFGPVSPSFSLVDYMRKSSGKSATAVVLAYIILACGWTLFRHWGPSGLMMLERKFVPNDALTDVILTTVTAVMLFWLVRRSIASQAQAQESLRRSHDELESRVQQRTKELAALTDISHVLASSLLSDQLFDVVFEQLNIMIDFSAAVMYTYNENRITSVAYRGDLPQEMMLGMDVPLESAPCLQQVVQRRSAVILDDLRGREDTVVHIIGIPDQRVSQSLLSKRSWMGIPMMIDERLIGLLCLAHAQPDFFSARDVQISSAIASQAAIAMENYRLYKQAHKMAVAEERQRMARELHDSVSQALYSIALGTHAAREQLTQAPEKVSSTLDFILDMSSTAVSEIRALIFELRPDSIEQEGLVVGLSKQAEAMEARSGVATQTSLGAEPKVLSLDGKECLYRIALEALQNVAKHAHAQNAHVRLFPEGSWIVLEVSDDGIGFDPLGRFPGHFGLSSMRERATFAGGMLEILQLPNAGTLVRARIPLGQSE